MFIKDDTSTRFRDEVRTIPQWVWFVAALGFLTFVGLLAFPEFGCRIDGLNWTCTMLSVAPASAVHPTKAVMVLLGIVLGSLVACLILLFGYINGDAGRRGMSRVLWTLLAIFVPNGIGILLYFLLRKPRILTCSQCGAVAERGFGFCSQCRHSLNVTCPQCHRGVNAGARFCPYCSADLGTAVKV